MSTFIPVTDDPRHDDPIFHAGFVKGLRGAACLMETIADVFKDDPRDDRDRILHDSAMSWADVIRTLADAAEGADGKLH